MNETQFYCGHLVYVHDILEIDQTAEYEGVAPEQIITRYCLKSCPTCLARTFEQQQTNK